MFYQRALVGSFRWTWPNIGLVVADALLLVGGLYLNSPYLVYAGALLLLFAVCRSVADSEANLSLGYLILLPLITLRLPMSSDLDAIHGLQRLTTSVASQVLNFFGFLHLRAGNVLEFPGKRFLVEEACSGVQSLFTVLFLAAIIACGYRRKIFHALLLLASACLFAGVMNVLRVSIISIAWSEFQWDLSVGWQHDTIGYLALICAAGLVFSADAAIDFVCSPVPDIQGAGVSAVYLNPLTYIWNQRFQVMPQRRKTSSTSFHTNVQPSSEKPASGYADDVNQREFPGFRDILRLRNVVAWLWGFIECWFVSRSYSRLGLTIPFLLVTIGGGLFVSWLRNAPQDTLVTRYEAATAKALQSGDDASASVFLKALVQLRPLAERYRFQLALHQLAHDQHEAAVSHLTVLTGADGYAPARLWLVNQAVEADPKIPLSPKQIEGQLQKILDHDPSNATANQMMAQRSAQRGQLKLAEDYLLRAVEQHPRLSLPLARIHQLLDRDKGRVEQQLSVAESESISRLMKNPADEQARVNRSDTLLLQNNFGDAERVLKEGLAIADSPTLRKALASLYSNLASRRMRASALNREHSQRLVSQAILLNPENAGYLQQALTLTALGVTYETRQLQPAIDALTAGEDTSIEQQVLLARAKATIGDFEGAIRQTQPLIESNPKLRLLLAGFLQSAGHGEEADVLTNQMLDEYQANGTVAELGEICDHAQTLMLTRKFEAAIELLTKAAAESDSATQHVGRRNMLYTRANLALFDERLEADTFTDTDEPMQLLDAALIGNGLSLAVIERLAKLSCSDNRLSTVADQRLTQLLAEGKANAHVYNLVGSQALTNSDAGKAKRYLERAYSLDPRNPMVLNNLALAVIRDDSAGELEAVNSERALRLANDALEVLPEHPDVLSTRGEVFIVQQRWEDARRDLEVALPKRLQSANIRRLLVRVFNALGDRLRGDRYVGVPCAVY